MFKFIKNNRKFISWSFLSNTIVSIENVLSTHNFLTTLNSNSEITNDIKTINYMTKDIIGQLGSIMYLSKSSNYIDNNPKKFILVSNLLQQFSYVSLSLTPIYPEFFIPISGVSGVLINISFTFFGAINIKCIEKISDNNIGEIYTKLTILNTISSTLGSLIGLYLNTKINSVEHRITLLYLLGISRIYTYNKSIEHFNL
jgi:hypothetical protein